MNAYEWLQQVQPGEVAAVVQITPAAKRSGRWADLQVTTEAVTHVNARSVKAAGVLYHKGFNGAGQWGRSACGKLIRPHAELQEHELKARRNAAFNALASISNDENPGLARLRSAMAGDGAEQSVNPVTVAALEELVRLRKQMNALASQTAELLDERVKAYWESVKK